MYNVDTTSIMSKFVIQYIEKAYQDQVQTEKYYSNQYIFYLTT